MEEKDYLNTCLGYWMIYSHLHIYNNNLNKNIKNILYIIDNIRKKKIYIEHFYRFYGISWIYILNANNGRILNIIDEVSEDLFYRLTGAEMLAVCRACHNFDQISDSVTYELSKRMELALSKASEEVKYSKMEEDIFELIPNIFPNNPLFEKFFYSKICIITKSVEELSQRLSPSNEHHKLLEGACFMISFLKEKNHLHEKLSALIADCTAYFQTTPNNSLENIFRVSNSLIYANHLTLEICGFIAAKIDEYNHESNESNPQIDRNISTFCFCVENLLPSTTSETIFQTFPSLKKSKKNTFFSKKSMESERTNILSDKLSEKKIIFEKNYIIENLPYMFDLAIPEKKILFIIVNEKTKKEKMEEILESIKYTTLKKSSSQIDIVPTMGLEEKLGIQVAQHLGWRVENLDEKFWEKCSDKSYFEEYIKSLN
eukprot:GHVL01039358.1.p1 GENE.GHVL01039358.1~~GHVL01039358.1.p1  ORF type:complete len:460 (+),score=107.05 GHVL01039358.1:92-1381(+)